MMDWSHPSLEPLSGADYSTERGRILRGRVIIAWMKTDRHGLISVYPAGRKRPIGSASSQAEALLMAIGHHERPRELS